jgi:hypothetical protein
MISGRIIQANHSDLFTYIQGDLEIVAGCCRSPEDASSASLVFARGVNELILARSHHPAILIVQEDAISGVATSDTSACCFSVPCTSRGMAALLKYFDGKCARFPQWSDCHPSALVPLDAIVGEGVSVGSPRTPPLR